MKKYFVLALLFTITIPVFVFADTVTPGVQSPITSFDQGSNSVMGLLDKAVTWMYRIFFVLAVGYILWAAYTFLRAGGDPKKVEEGKSRIRYAIIAIAVALISTGASLIISSFITSTP